MYKYFKIFLLTTYLIFNVNYLLAVESNIAFIDMNFLMNNSKAGKKMITSLEKKGNLENKKFIEIEKSLKSEEAKLVAQKNVLDNNEFKKKIESLKSKVLEYRQSRNNSVNEINKDRIKAQSSLLQSITPILTDYAEKNSLSMVIDKKNIILGKTELDITKNILKIVDEKVKNIK